MSLHHCEKQVAYHDLCDLAMMVISSIRPNSLKKIALKTPPRNTPETHILSTEFTQFVLLQSSQKHIIL